MLVLDLKANGVDAQVAKPATTYVGDAFELQDSYAVLTMDDVRQLVSLEQTRSLLGCDSNACMADISKAANADLVINGTVGTLGGKLTVSLALMDSNTAQVRNRASASMGGVKELGDGIRTMVTTLMGWQGAAQRPAFKLPSGRKTSFAVLDLEASGVADTVAVNLTQILSSEIKRVDGASVISRDDIKAMLQLEQDKSKLGCDSMSCLAEIGGALGVEKLVTGNVGKLADSYVISLRLISVQSTRVENRVSESFSGGEEQLIRAIRHAGRKLLGIEPEEAGALAVGASEEGAEVVVDGNTRGKLPMPPLRDLRPGPHQVLVSKAGYFDWKGDVYVDPGDSTVLWADLQARPLKWYQKWWVWTVMGSAGATVLGLMVLLAVTAVSGIAVLAWASQAPPAKGDGVVTVDP